MPEETDWVAVVEQIRRGDPAGQEVLYRNLSGGARIFLRRRLGTQEVEDQVHDLFVNVVQAIQRGELREPSRLMGFVRTLLYRQLSAEIDRLVRSRRSSTEMTTAAVVSAEPTPEEAAITRQKREVMTRLLTELRERDYEVLDRFYFRGQTEQQIRSEMALTATQFHLLKSRAKARFARLVGKRLRRARSLHNDNDRLPGGAD